MRLTDFKHILIVDDDDKQRGTLRGYLQQVDSSLSIDQISEEKTVISAIDAIKKIDKESSCFFVVDMYLPMKFDEEGNGSDYGFHGEKVLMEIKRKKFKISKSVAVSEYIPNDASPQMEKLNRICDLVILRARQTKKEQIESIRNLFKQ